MSYGRAVFFSTKTVQQVAALPIVPMGRRIDVLLITSRRRGRWIVPKGWPVGKRTSPDMAACEALEEAGVIGPVCPEPVGTYTYMKFMRFGYRVPCRVLVYPLLVLQHATSWREQDERVLRWCSLQEAAGLVDDKDLARILADLAAQDGAPLWPFIETAMAAAA
jgi:8-oxo-dGTP pyrophosphatase MutT (NUDIX family)